MFLFYFVMSHTRERAAAAVHNGKKEKKKIQL
jgi:hypothetical protein